MSKECKSRLTCEQCNLKHPTILHIQDKDKINKPQEIPVNSALVSLQACGCTGAGDQDCTLSIVPVQLKSKKGDKVLQTYAFLDPGSTATFCTNRFMKKLNLPGTKTNIMLRTMGQKVVESQILTGLEVSRLDDNQFFGLPETFTQETIPVSKGNIPTQRDIERWEYLKEIRIPELNADVEILIGTNAPKLMEPWEIINSQGDGPYAVRTLLGWVVNGPLKGNSGCCKQGCSTIYANRISIVRPVLEKMDKGVLAATAGTTKVDKACEDTEEITDPVSTEEDVIFVENTEADHSHKPKRKPKKKKTNAEQNAEERKPSPAAESRSQEETVELHTKVKRKKRRVTEQNPANQSRSRTAHQNPTRKASIILEEAEVTEEETVKQKRKKCKKDKSYVDDKTNEETLPPKKKKKEKSKE